MNRKFLKVALAALLVALRAAAHAQKTATTMVGGEAMYPMKNIVENAESGWPG